MTHFCPGPMLPAMAPTVIDKRFTADEVRGLIARAELLIGKPLEQHVAAVSSGVRPRHRHRLIELLVRLRAITDLSNERLIGAAATNAAELNAALNLYGDWNTSPAWPDYQRALTSPRDYWRTDVRPLGLGLDY